MKKFLLSLGAIGLLVGLAGCSWFKPSFADDPKVAESLTVYDANDKEVLRTENKDAVDRFNNRIEGHENTEADSEASVDLPEDAKLAYRIVYSTEQKLETEFLVYENYDIVTFTGIPIVKEVHFEVSKDFADWLRHPDKWETE